MTPPASEPRTGLHLPRAFLVAVLLLPYWAFLIDRLSINIFGPSRTEPIHVIIVSASVWGGVWWAARRGRRSLKLLAQCLAPVFAVSLWVGLPEMGDDFGASLIFIVVWQIMTLVIPILLAIIIRAIWKDGVKPAARPSAAEPDDGRFVRAAVVAPGRDAEPAPTSYSEWVAQREPEPPAEEPAEVAATPATTSATLPIKQDGADPIREAINAGDLARARTLLRDALKTPSAELYYLAAHAALDAEQRRRFLQQALDLDPFHSEAYAAQEAAGH